jgi:hypothetical protein
MFEFLMTKANKKYDKSIMTKTAPGESKMFKN